jgi:hypothetical protein
MRRVLAAAGDQRAADYDWICRQCFDDFRDLFQWRTVNDD